MSEDCTHPSLKMYVLEDMTVRYENDATIPARDRFGDTTHSEGYHLYGARCDECERHFDQKDIKNILGLNAVLSIKPNKDGSLTTTWSDPEGNETEWVP